MKIIRSIPILASLLSYAIISSFLGTYSIMYTVYTILLFNTGEFINRIAIKFPEDEASPYFQINVSKAILVLFGVISIVGAGIYFINSDFKKSALFIWVYLNVISGYFYRELA